MRRPAAAYYTSGLRSSRGVMWAGMVGLAGQDLVRAEELLEQHHAGQQVRQRQRPERDALVAALELGPDRPADDQADIAACLAALLHPLGERFRGALPAARVEQADVRPIRDAAGGGGLPPAPRRR